MHGCPEDMLTWTQMEAALDAKQAECDQLRRRLCANEDVCNGFHGADCLTDALRRCHDLAIALDEEQHAHSLARDELAAYLAKGDGATAAQLASTLSVLRSLVRALPDRMRYEFSPHSLALLNALNAAEAKIAEVGR